MQPPYQTFEQICEGLATHPDAWRRIREEQLNIPLLPFLEHPYSTVAARLIDGLAAAGIPRAEAQRVSLRELVVFALSGPMRWTWGGYAVSWIEAGFSIDDEIASALESIAQDKRFPQRVRHRAFAATRRWRRAKADPADADMLDGRLPTRRNGRLVLLPGLDGTGRLLRDFRRAIGLHATTILVRYPVDRILDYAALEAFVRSRMPRRKPFVLLAESFSGPIAISIAASRPARLRGLILACSFARNPIPMLGPLAPLIRLLPIRWTPPALLAWPTLGRFTSPALQSELREILSQVPPSVIAARLRAVLEVDVSALLTQVAVPILYLRACEDRLVPPSTSGQFAVLPHARIAQIKGPHFLLQACPAATSEEVMRFLREIDADATSAIG
jgi:pimeloyl-ACP methyl ester carboxylesterase